MITQNRILNDADAEFKWHDKAKEYNELFSVRG
jgi:hypothetical protein